MFRFTRIYQLAVLTLVISIGMVIVSATSPWLRACPFCSAINLTFAEQINANDIVVIAKLLEIPPPATDPDEDLPKAKFEVVSVLKGEKIVAPHMKFRALLIGRHEVGQSFLVMGVDPPNVAWTTPMKASDRVVDYISHLGSLPTKGAERLLFFQKYFEDEESILAFDAYDEFARAPYEDLIAMKDQMDRKQLLEWIKSPETSINRRKLYFTMLGVCGKPEDAKLLEGFIRSGDRKKQAGLDALIACFLNLRGADGIALIEETFLKDKEVEYVDTLAAVAALRFHGTEMDLIPKERIVSAVRLLLDRPKMADMIIPDLARWEDWSVMEKLVQMFKDADEESNWIRVPVITYLRACPRPEAKGHIDELAKIDPDAVKRADYFLDFEMDTEAGDDDSDETDTDAQESVNSQETDDGAPVESESTAEKDQFVAFKVPVESDSNGSGVESAADLMEPASNLGEAGNVYETTNQSQNRVDAPGEEQVAQVLPVAPVSATVSTPRYWTIKLIAVPLLVSGVIFVLLWSVINGWFERLVF